MILLAAMPGVFATSGWGHGALDERIRELTMALEARPADAGLRFTLADVYVQHEDWTAALEQLDVIDRLAAPEITTDVLRGRALLGDGRLAEARVALDRFLQTHASEAPALLLRARALGGLGEMQAALDDYRAAWRLTPTPEPDLAREVADALASNGQLDEAVNILAAAVERLGPVPSLLVRAMELEAAAGRFDSALSRIAALQQSAPRPEPWMAKRAELLARAGRTTETRAAWQELIDHLAALPNLERGSHALSRLAERARAALTQLSVNHSEPSQIPST